MDETMRHVFGRCAGVGLLVAFVSAGTSWATQTDRRIIDRMVAIVDGEVVTQGDIEEYRVLARFFGAEPSDDDDVVLRQIIENRLLAREIARFPGNAIRQADVDAYLRQFGDPGELPAEVIRNGARRRMELDRYYATLRRLMRATDAEIQGLYQTEFVPAARASGEVVPPLGEVRAQLEEIIVADKLSQEISLRVETLYRSYQVEVVE
jgi:hypothetical protein